MTPKKLIHKLLHLTVIAGLVAMGSGCSDNEAVKLRYEAEKKLHRAERLLEKANIKPELVSPSQMVEVKEQYREAADYSIDALSALSKAAHPVEYLEVQMIASRATTRLAQMLYADRKFGEAIAAMTRLLETPDLADEHILTTRINLGKALQASGNWDSALAVHNETLERFYPPVDEKGEVQLALFNLPLRILTVVNMTGDSAALDREFDRVVDYYSGLIESYPGEKVAMASHGNLARLYEETGAWEKEIAELSQMLDTTSNSYLPIKAKIADIYGINLGNHKRALNIYEEVLDEIEGADTVLIPEVRFKIARARMSQGKYAEARQMLVDIKENYPRYFATNPMAQFAMCRSFELEGNWNRAEVEYNLLIENYRGSDEAMKAFLYIAEHLEETGRTAEAEKWYRDAEEYYKELAALGSGTVIEAKALAYQADIHRKQKNWPRAAELLTEIFERYPETEPGRRSLLRASAIYREHLDDPVTADSLIDVFKASVAELIDVKES